MPRTLKPIYRLKTPFLLRYRGGGREYPNKVRISKLFLSRRAYDIAQPDVINVGGISEIRNVSMSANMLGIQFNPHVWGSPIMIVATLPPCPPSVTPEPFVQEPVMELDRTPSKIRDHLCYEPFESKEGYVAVPTGPGLGIDINEKTLA